IARDCSALRGLVARHATGARIERARVPRDTRTEQLLLLREVGDVECLTSLLPHGRHFAPVGGARDAGGAPGATAGAKNTWNRVRRESELHGLSDRERDRGRRVRSIPDALGADGIATGSRNANGVAPFLIR